MAEIECTHKFSAPVLWMWLTFTLAGAKDPTPAASRNVFKSLSRIHQILGWAVCHL